MPQPDQRSNRLSNAHERSRRMRLERPDWSSTRVSTVLAIPVPYALRCSGRLRTVDHWPVETLCSRECAFIGKRQSWSRAEGAGSLRKDRPIGAAQASRARPRHAWLNRPFGCFIADVGDVVAGAAPGHRAVVRGSQAFRSPGRTTGDVGRCLSCSSSTVALHGPRRKCSTSMSSVFGPATAHSRATRGGSRPPRRGQPIHPPQAHDAGFDIADHCRSGTGSIVTWLDATPGGPAKPEVIMGPAIVHAQIRSSASDARAFFGQLFGWTYPTEAPSPATPLPKQGARRAHRRPSGACCRFGSASLTGNSGERPVPPVR
jgi:hypothetical protein